MRTEYPARDLSILDLLPPGVSKGWALERLAARLGVDRKETMAIGDNWNDVDMLEWAGQSVMMGNAAPELRDHGQDARLEAGPAQRRGRRGRGAGSGDGTSAPLLECDRSAESRAGVRECARLMPQIKLAVDWRMLALAAAAARGAGGRARHAAATALRCAATTTRRWKADVRLYLSAGEDNYIELRPDEIASFEKVPDPRLASACAAPTARRRRSDAQTSAPPICTRCWPTPATSTTSTWICWPAW